jgi:hypothetical protein
MFFLNLFHIVTELTAPQSSYDLLPITEDHEWVPASNGRIPEGRRPVDGGYRPIERLHHAYAVIDGCSVPGTASEELGKLLRLLPCRLCVHPFSFSGGVHTIRWERNLFEGPLLDSVGWMLLPLIIPEAYLDVMIQVLA